MKKLLFAVGFLTIATSTAWAQVYVYPGGGGYYAAPYAPYGYGGGYYAAPYAPEPYAAPPGYYGFYGFDPTANNWDYYRTDQPGRGNNAESTR